MARLASAWHPGLRTPLADAEDALTRAGRRPAWLAVSHCVADMRAGRHPARRCVLAAAAGTIAADLLGEAAARVLLAPWRSIIEAETIAEGAI